ncbi:MAG: hypothetical protein ACTSUE_02290 [Promethearchaeota archaeon]
MKKKEATKRCKRVLIVGQGGSGKSYLYEKYPCSLRSVKYTTRPMREGDQHGIDYYFVDEYTFSTMKEQGLFKFEEKFRDWNYGTTIMSWNNHCVFILPPSIVLKHMSRADIQESYIIFLDIPKSTRRERLLKRCDADSVERRLAADLMDFSLFFTWSYQVTDPLFDAEALVEIALKEIKI